MTIFFVLIIFFIDVNCNKYFTKDFGVFNLNVYCTNKNNEKIEITKDQIINDIVNNKIENNNSNLQVYKQTFAIDYKEYDLLKEYEDRYNFWSEFKKIEIFE